MKNRRVIIWVFVVLALALIAAPAKAAIADTLVYFLKELLKVYAFLNKLMIVIAGQIMKLYVDILEQSLLSNPDIYPLKDPSSGNLTTNGAIIAGFLKILAPVYFISLLMTGLYMIFMAESPSGRASAKNNLDKLLVSMILVAVAPGIYQILIEISKVTTNGVLSVVRTALAEDETIADAVYSSLMSAQPQTQLLMLPLFGIVIWILTIALLVMWFRYLIVLVFGLIFPILIFLYLFGFTKTFGAKMLRFALVWIFTPALSALWLAIAVFILSASASESFTGGLVTPFLFATAMFMISIAPLVMSGLMEWLGGLVAMAGMMIPGGWGIALAALGGVMQGKDLGSIAGSTIGLKLQFHNLLKKGMSAAGQKAKSRGFGALGMAGKVSSKAGGLVAAGGEKLSNMSSKLKGTRIGSAMGAVMGAGGTAMQVAAGSLGAAGGKMQAAHGQHTKSLGEGKISQAKGKKDKATSLQARGDKLKSGGVMSQLRAKVGMYGTRAKLAERRAGKLESKGIGLKDKGDKIMQKSKEAAPGMKIGDTKLGKFAKAGRDKVAGVTRTARGAVASKSMRLTSLAGVDRDTAKILRTSGYKNKGAVAGAKVEDLQKAGLSAEQAKTVSESAKSHVAGERQKAEPVKPEEPSVKDQIKDGIKEDQDKEKKERLAEVQLKSQLASPGRKSRDKGQRTEDIIDGMDAE